MEHRACFGRNLTYVFDIPRNKKQVQTLRQAQQQRAYERSRRPWYSNTADREAEGRCLRGIKTSLTSIQAPDRQRPALATDHVSAAPVSSEVCAGGVRAARLISWAGSSHTEELTYDHILKISSRPSHFHSTQDHGTMQHQFFSLVYMTLTCEQQHCKEVLRFQLFETKSMVPCLGEQSVSPATLVLDRRKPGVVGLGSGGGHNTLKYLLISL